MTLVLNIAQTVLLAIITLALTTSCSSLVAPKGRVFLDSTTHNDSPPDWVKSLKSSWEKDKQIFVKVTHTIRGDERVNACYDLVAMDAKERILSELANEVRGSLDTAVDSISEDAEVVLGKVRSGEFSGRITGLRINEQYFERYLIADTERVDCHILAQISASDYNTLKRQVVHQVAKADPRIREAIANKQAQFFHKTEQ